MVKLLYVDYGNEEEIPISETRPIPSTFCQLPAQALYCSLLLQDEDVDVKLAIVIQQWLSHTIVGLPSSVKIESYVGKNNAVIDIEVAAAYLLSESSLRFLEEKFGVLPDVIGNDHEMISVCKVLESVIDKVKMLQHLGTNFSNALTIDESECSETPCFSEGYAMPDIHGHDSLLETRLCKGTSCGSMLEMVLDCKNTQGSDQSIAGGVYEQFMCRSTGREDKRSFIQHTDLVDVCDASPSAMVNTGSCTNSSPTVVKAIQPFCLQLEGETPSFALMVSHIDSVSNFYVHPVQLNSLTLLDLESSLSHYYSGPGVQNLDPSNVRRGAICCIQCPEDEMWYRAVVTEVQHAAEQRQEKCCVFYFDFGVSETVSTTMLKVLPPQFLSVPAQCICCSLTYFDSSSETAICSMTEKDNEVNSASDDALLSKTTPGSTTVNGL